MSNGMLHKQVTALSAKSISMLSSLDNVFKNDDMNKQSELYVQYQEYCSNKDQITWLIEKSAIDKKVSYGQYIESPKIKISSAGIRNLVLYPNGKKVCSHPFASLDVHFKNLPKNMHLECNISVMGKDRNILLSKTFSGDTSDLNEINFDDFFLKSNIQNYLVNNKLNIQCTVKCFSEIYSCVSDKSKHQVHETPDNNDYMRLILNNGKYSDLIMELSSKMIKCHKYILASESPALSVLLRSSNRNILDMHDKTTAIIEDLLSFIYSGNIPVLNFSHTCELYIAANNFVLLNLRDVCSVFLSSSLTVKNVPYILELSTGYKDPYLIKACIKFMKSNNIKNLTDNFMNKSCTITS